VQDHRKTRGVPVGRYTATGVPTEAVGCEIWITNTKNDESRPLTEGKHASWAPVWSPDGKHLAFYSDQSGTPRLWVWDTATGQTRQLADAIVRPFFNFQVARWTPDSRKILSRMLPEGMTVEQAADLSGVQPSHEGKTEEARSAGASVTVYSSLPTTQVQESSVSTKSTILEEEHLGNLYLADLALVDEATGKVDRFVKGARPLGYWISPDGHYVAYTHLKGTEPNTQQDVFELVLVDFVSQAARSLVSDIEFELGISVSWSPDSRFLAYTTSGQMAKGDCFIVSIAGGDPQNLTAGGHPSFSDYYRAPLWDAIGSYIYLISSERHGRLGTDSVWRASLRDHSLSVAAKIPNRVILEVLGPSTGGRVWSPDGGRSLVVETRDETTKQVGIYAVDLSNGKASKLFEEDSYFGNNPIFSQDVSRDGKTVAYAMQDAKHPENIWIASSVFANRRRVTSNGPDLNGVALGATRVIDWYSVDGIPLHGALILPSNYKEGNKYPLIVNLYGGSYLSETVYRFGVLGSGLENLQLFATRGYAVLVPDTPLRDGSPMLDLLKTVAPGIDRVVDLGIADPKRIGVMGHSYGGYSTLALIVQTTRFRAAVEVAGFADLISGYGHLDRSGSSSMTGFSETGTGRMRGTPWQYRDRYVENSPLFYLDRVNTPLLILHGELDRAVPYQQADEVFVGLRRLGKEVEYARYEGEEHVPSRWSYANQLDFFNRMVAWFDKHLKEELDRKHSLSSSQTNPQ